MFCIFNVRAKVFGEIIDSLADITFFLTYVC